MVILLYGPDALRRARKLTEIVEEFKKKNPGAMVQKFDLEGMKTINGNGNEFSNLKDFSVSRSIFASKKLGIINNIWTSETKIRGKKSSSAKIGEGEEEKEAKDTKSIKELKKILEHALESKELSFVISEEKAPLAAFKFLLQKPSYSEEFDELAGKKLEKFIEEEADRESVNLSREVLEFLTGFYGSNTWGLATEIQKLSLLDGGSGKAITVDDLKKTGDYPQTENIFHFINSLGRIGGLVEKITTLEKLFFAREEPAKIFNILAASNYISPEFVVKLADYDVSLKSGRMDYEEILLDLALN